MPALIGGEEAEGLAAVTPFVFDNAGMESSATFDVFFRHIKIQRTILSRLHTKHADAIAAVTPPPRAL